MDPLSYDYNIVLTTFYISYIVFELPANILCKAIGPGKYIPFSSSFRSLLITPQTIH